MAARLRNKPRSHEEMAVIHLGRAMRSLGLAGVDKPDGDTNLDFVRASRLIAQASDALIDAMEKQEGTFVERDADGDRAWEELE